MRIMDKSSLNFNIQLTTTEDNVKKTHDLVLADRRLKVCEIAETVSISKDCVGHVLHEILDMRKLSARWVSRDRKSVV